MPRQFALLMVAAIVMTFLLTALYLRPPRYNRQFATKTLVITGVDSPLFRDNEEFAAFLRKQLGIYGGQVEIVQMITLNTRDITGRDYVLVTLRAPNGTYYQTVISKDAQPWSKWEFDPKTFCRAETIQLDLARPIRLDDFVPREVLIAYQLDSVSARNDKIQSEFEKIKDNNPQQKTVLGRPLAPVEPQVGSFKLELGKDKKWHFTTVNKESANDTESYWKTDYPTEYTGGGYRSYLYNKIKDQTP
jgi:hypothetical protein